MSYEDPLDKIFDLVVLGTGTTASIIAAAASKHGYSVVHLDRHEFYGTTETTLSLPQFQNLLLSQYVDDDLEIVPKPIPSGNTDTNAFVPAPVEYKIPLSLNITETIPVISSSSLSTVTASSSSSESMSTNSSSSFSPFSSSPKLPWLNVYDPPPEDPSVSPTSISSSTRYSLPSLLSTSGRRIAIDIHPSLTLSRGKFTTVLVNSNVASYLEYKPLDCAYLAIPPSGDVLLSSSLVEVMRVPANKSDIFANHQLSLVEKRKLMKFLQFAQDERIKYEEEEEQKQQLENSIAAKNESQESTMDNAVLSTVVATLNERELGNGRSLLRPQNKSTSHVFDSRTDDSSVNNYSNKTIEELFYATGITGSLFPMFAYAVALLEAVTEYKGISSSSSSSSLTRSTTVSAKDGMQRINQYLGAIGRYGRTAFITNMYGSGEIPQAFCRLCAVKGGIYMLRTNVEKYFLGHHLSNSENKDTKSNEEIPSSSIAKPLLSDPSPSSSPTVVAIQTDSPDARYLRCHRVLTEFSYLPSAWQNQINPQGTKYITLVGTVIRQSPLDLPGFLPSQALSVTEEVVNKELIHIIFPPYTIPATGTFPYAINLYQQGASNAACPNGWYIVQLYTRITVNDKPTNVYQSPSVLEGVNAIRQLITLLFKDTSIPWKTIYGIMEDVVPLNQTVPMNPNLSIPSNVIVIPNCFTADQGTNLIHMEDSAVLAETVFRSLYPSTKVMFAPSNAEENGEEYGTKEEDKIDISSVPSTNAATDDDTLKGNDTLTEAAILTVTSDDGLIVPLSSTTPTIEPTPPPVLDVHAALALLEEEGDNVFDL